MINYEGLFCNKDYLNKIDEELKRDLRTHFSFFNNNNNNINKFILLLRKGVYPCEYMNDWKMFKQTSLPEKKEFYSNLIMEDITDADYMNVKKVCKDFEIKNLVEYDDFYLKSDALLLADFFLNFRKVCFKIHELDPANFL